MKKIFLLLFLATFAMEAQIQSTPFASQSGMQIFTKVKEPDSYTGTPYYEKEFQPGTIHDDKGRSLDVLMRYNALEDVVVVKAGMRDKESYMLPKLKTITYELADYTYFIDNIHTENGWIEAYFAKYYEGPKASFIGRPEVDVIPAKKAATGYDKDKPANIDVEMVYYLSLNGEKYKEVRLKEKDLEDFFSSDKMEEYFDEHKIKTEKDVVGLLKFYENNI